MKRLSLTLVLCAVAIGLLAGEAAGEPSEKTPAGLSPGAWSKIRAQLPPARAEECAAPQTLVPSHKLTASDGAASDNFGAAVSASGDAVIVGVPKAAVGGVAGQGAAYLFARNQGGADAWGQVARLAAADGATNDHFGSAVALSGDTAVVGAALASVGGNASQGAAYVFTRNQGGADAWGQTAKLTAADGAASAGFGNSVAIHRDTVVIGAHQAQVGGNVAQGAAYVFTRNQGGADNWGQTAKLVSSEGAANDHFGFSVAVSGDLAAAAALGNAGHGAAYLFARNQGGADAWDQVQRLAAPGGAGEGFGFSIALCEDTLAVGAPFASAGGNPSQGAAEVFARNQGGADAWGHVQRLTASDGAAQDLFGYSLALNTDKLIAGAPGHSAQRGAAYLFTRNQAGTNAWGQVKRLTAADGVAGDLFGQSAALSGSVVFLGAPEAAVGGKAHQGSVYAFTEEERCGDLVRQLTALDGAPQERFGDGVAVSGNTAIIGATVATASHWHQGAAYVLARNQGGTDAWGQVAKICAPDGQTWDEFGLSVAVSGDTAIAGCPGRQAAYVFSRNQGGADQWGFVAKLTTADPLIGDTFALSVGLSGDTAVVSAHTATVDGKANQGAAYVFARNQGGADHWGQVARLTASDGVAYDGFGWSVAVDGDTVAAGVPYSQRGESTWFQGLAYVFARNQGGADHWGQVAVLTPADGQSLDLIGFSLAVNGDAIILGAPRLTSVSTTPGAAYVFRRNQGGADQWDEVARLVASDGAVNNQFGASVDLSGDLAIVGACGDNASQGAAYLFQRNAGGADAWGQIAKRTDPNGAANDHFGDDVAIFEGAALVGAFWKNNGQGEADLYNFSHCFCTAPNLTGIANTAADVEPCAKTGVALSWPRDPADLDWGYSTSSGLSYDLLRDGEVFQSGVAYGTTSWVDTTGEAMTPYTYAVRYVNGCGAGRATAGAEAADIVTVVTVSNPAISTFVFDSPVNQSFTQSGGLDPVTFALAGDLPSGLTLAADGTLSGTPMQTGAFFLNVIVTDANGCTGASPLYVLVVTCPLSLAPTYPREVCTGQPATLAVTATGIGPFSYQWFRSADGVDFRVIPGAAASSYTSPPLSADTVFRVETTGACASTSKTMTVNVARPPAVTVQPAGATVRSGQSATLTVGFTGTEPVSVQWFEGAQGDTSRPVDGASAAVFETPALDRDALYWARLTNDCGSVDSEAAAVTVLNTYYVPHAASTALWWTRLDFVNAGDAAQPVILDAYGADGALQEHLELPPLAPRAKAELDFGTLFGKAALSGDCWVQVTSPAVLKGLATFGTQDHASRTGLPFQAEGCRRLAFPYVALTDASAGSYYTGLTLVNVGAAGAAATLTAWDETGAKLAEATTAIPAKGKYVRLLSEVFPTLADPKPVRCVTVASDQPLAGFELFGTLADQGLAGLPAVCTDPPEEEGLYWALCYGELPDNAAWYTGLTFVNLDPKPALVTGAAFDAAGVFLGAEQWTLQPMEQLTREAWSLLDPARYETATHLLVGSFQRVGGFELALSRTTPFRFDGLPVQALPSDRLTFPVTPSAAGASTRLRLINKANSAMSAVVKAYDASGVLLGTCSVALASHQSLDLDPAAIFPASRADLAWVGVEGDNRLFGDAFVLDDAGQTLTMYPGLP